MEKEKKKPKAFMPVNGIPKLQHQNCEAFWTVLYPTEEIGDATKTEPTHNADKRTIENISQLFL